MLKISELLGKKIKQSEWKKTEHKVEDVIFREDNHTISYIVYHVKTFTGGGENMALDDGLMNKASTWVSGMNASNVPSTGLIGQHDSNPSKKDTYYISWIEVEGIDEEKVLYKGNERQKSVDDAGVSWQRFKGLKVVHPDGKELGEISDGVLNERSGEIEGWIVTGSFWKQLMGEGTKTIQLDGKPDWNTHEWKLQSEPELLMQKH